MKIKIIHHNVRHWINPMNINENSNFYLSKDPDIITINSHSIRDTRKNVKLFNYSGYTKNKINQAGSGVAILVKQNIQHIFHTNTINENIMAVTIDTTHGKLTIITFYRPPRQDTLPLTDIQNFLNYNHPTIILADANIKHPHFGHNNSNRLGTLLNNFNNTVDLHYIGPNFNTFFSHNMKGKPDIILVNTAFLTLAYNLEEGPRLTSSDHIPITLTASTSPIAIPTAPRYNYNRADWPKFTEHMKLLPLPNIINKPTEDIDKLWETLIKHIQDGANNYIPKTTFKKIPALNDSRRTRNL